MVPGLANNDYSYKRMKGLPVGADTPPAVRQLVALRKEHSSCRDKRRDPWHLALIVECGGMRATDPAGVIKSLGDATEQFDEGARIYLEGRNNGRG